ncbi:hypothetical protein [Nostoc linckia]|nr:hypothetical protein [Nostoc linckia]
MGRKRIYAPLSSHASHTSPCPIPNAPCPIPNIIEGQFPHACFHE